MSGGTQQQQRRRFPSNWHLVCLAIITFLGVSGHVSLQNAAVVVLSTLYLLLLSTFSFPSTPTADITHIFPASRILPIYVLFAGVAGLLLPLCYVLHGIYVAGDGHGAAAAAPHLFLLTAQVVMEGVASAAQFSVPIRAFVPIFYNSWRMPAVFEWARSEMMTSTSERGGSQLGRVYFGRVLALINLGLWSFNLFGFLLPVYLPRAFKRRGGALRPRESIIPRQTMKLRGINKGKEPLASSNKKEQSQDDTRARRCGFSRVVGKPNMSSNEATNNMNKNQS